MLSIAYYGAMAWPRVCWCVCIVQLPLLAEVHIRSVLRWLYLVLPPSLEMQVFILVSAACEVIFIYLFIACCSLPLLVTLALLDSSWCVTWPRHFWCFVFTFLYHPSTTLLLTCWQPGTHCLTLPHCHFLSLCSLPHRHLYYSYIWTTILYIKLHCKFETRFHVWYEELLKNCKCTANGEVCSTFHLRSHTRCVLF